jgi:hypothetical protein
MATTDNPNTFETEQVQPTELELLAQRMENYSIPLKPATAQATLATVTRGLEKGMFKIEELDAIITIREEVNKGIIDYNGAMKMAQERMQILQQEEIIKQQEDIAKAMEAERVKTADERLLRKRTQDRLKVMEEALAKAGLSIDLDGDGVIGLPSGESTTPLTETEQQRVDQIIADTPAPTPAPKTTSSAFKMARMLNPVTEPTQEPYIPLDTPQSHTKVETTIAPISTDEDFVEKVDEVKKSFSEFVEDEVTQTIELPVEPVNEDAIISGESTEAFLDEVERVNEVADADEMDLTDEVPPTIVNEVAPTPPPFVTGGNAPNITGMVGNTPNIKAKVDEVDELDQFEQDLIDEEQFNQSFAEVDEPVIEEPTLDVGYEQPVLGENDVVIKQDQIKTIENYEDLEAEEEFEEVVIPNRNDLEKMTKAQIEKSAEKLSFSVNPTDTKSVMIDTYESQANALIESLTEGNEFVSSTEEDLDNGNEDRRDGGYF